MPHQQIKKGCLAVTVGQGAEQKRFVIPVKYVNHPLFTQLLKEAEEEYGFDQKGPINIPCRVYEFCQLRSMIEVMEQTASNHHHPKGYLAVTVGQREEQKRFVIPVKHVNHPLFTQLLEGAEEDYGLDQHGPINIPCPVEEFCHVIRGLIDTKETTSNHHRHHHSNHHHHSCFKAC